MGNAFKTKAADISVGERSRLCQKDSARIVPSVTASLRRCRSRKSRKSVLRGQFVGPHFKTTGEKRTSLRFSNRSKFSWHSTRIFFHRIPHRIFHRRSGNSPAYSCRHSRYPIRTSPVLPRPLRKALPRVFRNSVRPKSNTDPTFVGREESPKSPLRSGEMRR